MAEKSFGVKEINLIGASGTPTIESPNNLNLNAVNVAISTNATIGGNLTVSGTVGIAGTLTYEDVTNVDAVGIITAREGISLPDSKNARFGTDNDGIIYHNGNHLFIKEEDAGQIFIDGAAGVTLQMAGSTRIETQSDGGYVTGSLGVSNKISAASVNIGSNIQLGNAGVVTATTFSGSGASLTNLPGIESDAQGNTVGGSNAGDSFNGTNAQYNTLIGKDAGTAITNGIRNTVLGYQALQTNTNSSYNVAIGYQALYTQNITTNPAGGQNVAIGDRAGYDVTDGRNSVYVGAGAGSNVTNGGENVIIGSYSGTQLTTGSNCIIFGQGAQASANNVSNEVTIGDSSINKFRIPGINFTLKDNGGTPTEGHVLTVDGSGEASFVGIAVTEAPVTDYTISANGSSAYRFHGGGVDETANNPDLYLIRGQKYRFNNTTGSGHPFAIRVSNGGSAYTDGVSGSNQGVQFFTVPYSAPASLVYQCTIHGGMVGNIYIRGGSSTANISNNADNRVITGGSGGELNGEANLRFNGSALVLNNTNGANYFEIGSDSSSQYAIIDLKGDTTYTDYAFRIMRVNSGANAESQLAHRGTGEFSIKTVEAAPIKFYTNNDERLRIDSNGMIGIGGVTPKTQNTFDAIEFGKTGFLGSQTGARTVEMASNAYYNSGWKYKENDVASQYYQYQGYHAFTSAVSGSADGAISFVERLRIESGGDVDITDGNLKLASGHGIDFGATGGPASGTGGSEILSDYEQGTFSPDWFDDGGAFVSSYTTQYGQYTKIGNVVYFCFGLRIGSFSRTPNSGQICRVGNLPYVSRVVGDDQEPVFNLYARLWGSGTPPETAWIRQSSGGSGSNHVEFYMDESQTGNDHALVGADFDTSATCRVVVNGFYFTTD